MFRLLAPLQRKSLSPSFYHTTQALRMPESKFNPEDWRIIKTSPGGIDRDFVNRKTGESTWYTPEGMSAAEILAVPGAREYWSTVKEVEEYIKEKAEEKKRNGERTSWMRRN
ncbi:hypothetical protein GALMADRAFT_159776 [Galerina marginata CBS 339.88]|uniref:WW domain-containing protein n=1 Tax=Galerina marginata (strain CBS 339.88) TaxID=685588 RepID=A0A067SHY9_GALM3|nr:hypothetical protein GALMADRAFT_159776 [Galerina marginata CBS 339.88]